MMANQDHPRLIIHNFLSQDLCRELGFIHKSCGTVGYRPNVFSTTLSHLIATNCPHLIMPFVPIRERLKDKVEEFFGCEFELFVEFTGLISWCKGASIGWHSDDNRPYLKQRDFAVVCYLNSYDVDFKGGIFHFQDSEPSTVLPMAGDVVMYTADSRNIHSVDEITDGERLTLTLWFSRDGSHDEDAKLLHFLSHSHSLLDRLVNEPLPFLPLAAPSRMYWFSPDQGSNSESGFDIRFARIHALGYGLYCPQGEGRTSVLDFSNDFSGTLMKPLSPTKGHELFNMEFANILHVLQVAQFHHWKASELQACKHEKDPTVVSLTRSQRDDVDKLRNLLLKDEPLAETLFGLTEDLNHSRCPVDWAGFSAAVSAWEVYSGKLAKELVRSLPFWRKHQSIYSVSLLDVEHGDESDM